MRSDVQAVVFDLDGTLLDRRSSFDRFMRNQWERFDACQAAEQDKYVQALIELDREGYAPRKELFTGAVAQFNLSPGMAETLLKDYRDGFANSCVLFPDAAHTLSSIRTAGLELGLITKTRVCRERSRPTASSKTSAVFLRGLG